MTKQVQEAVNCSCSQYKTRSKKAYTNEQENDQPFNRKMDKGHEQTGQRKISNS